MSLVPISKFINEQPEWWTDMSVAQQKQYLSTYQKSKHKVVPDNPSGKEERDDIAKQRKHDYSNAPHESEPGFGDSESGYDVNAWNEHYVRRDENGSATIGTAHVSPVNSEDYPGGENDKDYLADKKASDTGRKFVEDNVIPEVDKVMDEAEAQGKEVVFLGEGGQGDGHIIILVPNKKWWDSTYQIVVVQLILGMENIQIIGRMMHQYTMIYLRKWGMILKQENHILNHK